MFVVCVEGTAGVHIPKYEQLQGNIPGPHVNTRGPTGFPFSSFSPQPGGVAGATRELVVVGLVDGPAVLDRENYQFWCRGWYIVHLIYVYHARGRCMGRAVIIVV